MKPGGLADALWHGHHAAAVEDEHERQLERANDLQQLRRIIRIRVDQALPAGERNPPTLQFGDEADRHRGSQH